MKKTENNNVYLWFLDNSEFWHDYSISMIAYWKLHAIEMERLDKIKHSSLKVYCNIKIEDYLKQWLAYLLINLNKKKYNLFTTNKPVKLTCDWAINMKNNNLFHHHYLHACSSYFWSSFENSAILTVDCFGKNTETGKNENQAIWCWNWNYVKQLYSLSSPTLKWIWIWIGRAYLDMVDLLGMEEGSIMWLSAYGNAERFNHLNMFDYDWLDVQYNKEYLKVIDRVSWPEWIFFYTQLFKIETKDYEQKEKDITKSIFADIAAKLQKEVEDAMVYLANKAYELTKSDNLCLAWWVTLNILANSKILERTKFKNIFVCPAANDWWISLGALYHGYHVINWIRERVPLMSAWLWNTYSNSEIKNTLEKYNSNLEYKKIDDYQEVAQLLSQDKIISWFQWWCEFWPRALWFRSILASPIKIETKDRVNKIKSREWWRPVAPSIMEEYLSEYFETDYSSPFMTLSANVKEDKKNQIPAIVHIDWTARYHTVNHEENYKYYDLLKLFYDITGIPILINTSFNVRWQPIVENPEDAIKTFLFTSIDYLVIWDYLVSKQSIYKEFSFNSSIEYLKTKYNTEKWKNLYIKKWNILRKIIFNNLVDSEFIFDDNGFKFLFIEEGKKYEVFLWKYDENKWYYKRNKDLCIRIETKNVFINLEIGIKMRKILDYSFLVIEKNYDDLVKIILE